jgi:hypothetical protein
MDKYDIIKLSINFLTGMALLFVLDRHFSLEWWETGIIAFSIQWFLGRD